MFRRFGLLMVVGFFVLSGLYGVFNRIIAEQKEQPSAQSLVLPGHYSQAVETSYLSACQAKGADPVYCQCTLSKMVRSYSQSEFLALNAEVQRNPKALPKKVVKIFRKCPHLQGGRSGGTVVGSP